MPSFSEEKEAKRLLEMALGIDVEPVSIDPKVSWFFFSKKNRFP
jgi:hypothetical protein